MISILLKSLIKIPFLTASRVAMVETVGIASPKAWGQAITSTVMARVAAVTKGWFNHKLQMVRVRIEIEVL